MVKHCAKEGFDEIMASVFAPDGKYAAGCDKKSVP